MYKTVNWKTGPARARYNLELKNKKNKKPQATSCDETKCLEKNTGLINGDWLCLDCGEKVKPQATSRKRQASSNKRLTKQHYKII